MKGEITDKHKRFVDNIFIHNFDKVKAYMEVYPDAKLSSARASVAKLIRQPDVKRYYEQEMEFFREEVTVSKEQILNGLENHIKLFDSMIALALKDELTDVEAAKLKRLNDMLKASDVIKAKDMLCKITGAYAAEKVEVEQITYNVNFGE
jgi:hypothetical protein